LGTHHEYLLWHGVVKKSSKRLLLHTICFADIGGEGVYHPPLTLSTVENPRMSNIKLTFVEPLRNHITKKAISTSKDYIPLLKGIQLGRGEAHTVFVFSHLPLFLLGIYIEKEMKPTP
jgi:hypothetical protein